MSKIFKIPQAMYTALGGDTVIPNVGSSGSVLCPPDSYETVDEASLGLQLNDSEWGSHGYALRRSIFSSDVVMRIERADADDFYAIAEGLKRYVEDLGGVIRSFVDDYRFSPGFIALRAAAWGFANRYHDDPGAVRAFGTRLNAIRFKSPLWHIENTNVFAVAMYMVFECEAVAYPEAMGVLETLACRKDPSAEMALIAALRSSSWKRGGNVGPDILSLGAALLGRVDRSKIGFIERFEDTMRRAFNTSPAVSLMIKDPQRFVELVFAYFSLADSDEEDFDKTITILAKCYHPRLNEAINSLFDLAKHNDSAFVMMCLMAESNYHALDLLDGMDVGDLLSRFQQYSGLVELLATQWAAMEAGAFPRRSIASALAKLDTLDMPEDESSLMKWMIAGSRRAHEILIERRREARTIEEVENGEGAAVISLRDHLKSTDPE